MANITGMPSRYPIAAAPAHADPAAHDEVAGKAVEAMNGGFVIQRRVMRLDDKVMYRRMTKPIQPAFQPPTP